jgi:hypothetical protein
MREVRDAHQPEGERETRREQEQQAAERDAVEGLDDPELHRGSVIPAARSCARAGIHDHRWFDEARFECFLRVLWSWIPDSRACARAPE